MFTWFSWEIYLSFRAFWRDWKRWKSLGAKSGEYGGLGKSNIFPHVIFAKWLLLLLFGFYGMSKQFNYQKTYLFQAIQFSQTLLIQLIQFSISTDFIYTQLNVKTVLY